MKFILVSPKNRTVYNFRGDLIRALQARGYEVIVTGPNQDDAERVRALGVRFEEIEMSKNGTNPLSDLKYRNRLQELFQREKPDCVLGYTVKPCIYGTWAAKRAGVANINAMITGVGYTFIATSAKAKLLKKFVTTLYRHTLKMATHVFFQNEDDEALFVRTKLVRSEVCSVVHGSGVNLTHFTPQPLPGGAPCFFMLSRLLKSKGVMEYLEAAELVKQKHPEARFMLLGKVENAMQDAVSAETLAHYTDGGIVERFEETTDVRPYYRDCSVYVLPSYSEGTPRTVLEAMANGRPILTTDANGCRQTVLDGRTGYLVPVRDSRTLADKMCLLLENPEQIAQMGQAALALCKEKYDVVKVNEELIATMKL